MKHYLLWLLALGLPGLTASGGWPATVKDGKLLLNLRFRVEYVDQKGIGKEAWAPTLRTRLGYQTAPWNGWTALLEFENTTVAGETRFNDTVNGDSSRPVVADPEDSEVNRLQLVYTRPGTHEIILGRQRMILNNARFIGNVGWRQNEQTFDGALWRYSGIKKSKLTLAYLANANRIFGEHHPRLSDFRLSSVLAQFDVAALPFGTLSLFGYFLDFDDVPTASHKNLGFRLFGNPRANDHLSFPYEISYVDQSPYQDGADINEASYYFLGWGPKWKSIGLKLNFEVLEGNELYAFATPLATLHAFNGWADRFLATPKGGLEDLFLTLKMQKNGWSFLLALHRFESEQGLAYGDEGDLQINKKIGKKGLIGWKLADYRADRFNTDTRKVWLYGQLSW